MYARQPWPDQWEYFGYWDAVLDRKEVDLLVLPGRVEADLRMAKRQRGVYNDPNGGGKDASRSILG